MQNGAIMKSKEFPLFPLKGRSSREDKKLLWITPLLPPLIIIIIIIMKQASKVKAWLLGWMEGGKAGGSEEK